MAEERSSETARSVAPAAKVKKKTGKTGLLFILMLLAFGVGAGLHFSGMWDARPLMWEAVPKIPYVGKGVAGFFGIPEQYTLTVEERRAFEQNERQRRLDERERDLIEREATVNAALTDIAGRTQQLADLEASMESIGARRADENELTAERDLIAQRVRDFNTMSARNSAQIVEEMRDELAVKILQGLTSDARASILGKMDARKAARLVELLSTQ
jgi:flagellar motility protein MotE (MotC chaperone)